MEVNISEVNVNSKQSTCYCFNPDCQQPVNSLDEILCKNCGTNLLLNNRYRGIKLLGQGGFGRTFQAMDEANSSYAFVAIKQFYPQQSHHSEKASELFQQEAKRLANLGNHPQIPQLFDYFVSDNRQYLVQEFIQGKTLAQELEEDGKFDEAKIVHLLEELLPVLITIHNHQVIHRDIKPENIIRKIDTNTQQTKLILVDFGAAKYATETSLGKTGTLIGSAAFTAPEQLRGKAIFASDIYSLGVSCVYLLTEIEPFELFDNSQHLWVWKHYLDKDKNVSKYFAKILDKMLANATKERYSSAIEVLKDLHKPQTVIAPQIIRYLSVMGIILIGFVGIRFLVTPIVRQTSDSRGDVTIEDKINPPDTGGLFTKIDGKYQTFPLQNTQVNAEIAGNVSRVEVVQTFANPYNQPLEAIYNFPLPENSAVDDMEIKIGDRIIKGVIKKREEAQQIYEEAKQKGKTAGLLEQQRDNIFTQSLANIKPGEKIDVTIRYTDSLKFEGGNYEFVFPMVVAPRYQANNSEGTNINPPNLSNNNQASNIELNVEIDAGLPVRNINSLNHPITTSLASGNQTIKLAESQPIANKDFILKYQVTGADTQATILTQSDEQGGHFAVYLIPAIKYNPTEIVPKDLIFMIDTSGSQRGAAIEQSKELMRKFIEGLNPQDTFNIIDFASTSQQLSPNSLTNTTDNRKKAIAYINNLEANGGTELMNGINTVLNFASPPEARLRSIVLITDGLIGDDKEVISKVQQELNPGNRLYSFGVGSSTNRFLVSRIAEVGRGISEVIAPSESATKIVEEFFNNINNPVLTNLEISWLGNGEKPEVYPQKVPDLFSNQPLVLYGKKGDKNSGQLKISGTMAGGKKYEKILNVDFNQIGGNSAIAQLWGRAKIKNINNEMYWQETPEGVKLITDTALAYNLVSDYTAFVAVSEETRVDSKDKTITEEVAVPLPERMASEAIIQPSSPITQSSTGIVPLSQTSSQQTPPKTVNSQPSASQGSQAASQAKSQDSHKSSNKSNGKEVPEPSQILGNLFGLLIIILLFMWRQKQKLVSKIKGEIDINSK